MAKTEARAQARKGLIMPAQCKTRNLRFDAEVLDLSESGCKFATKFVDFEPGDEIVLMPEGFEGFRGKVRWIKGSRAGIQFAKSLHSAVVDHLCRHYPDHKWAFNFDLGAAGLESPAR